MALGAQPQAIVQQFLAEVRGPLAGGVLIGGAAAVGLTRYTASMRYGVTPLDALSFGAGIFAVALVVTLAAVLPARRAARLDPAVALRD